MATIQLKRNKYFSRITWRLNSRKKEVTIPLKTQSKTEAETRKRYVENYEDDIKSGVIEKYQFKNLFPWLNAGGESVYKTATINDVFGDYLDYRMSLDIKITSVNIDRDSLVIFRKWYKDKPLDRLTDSILLEFINFRKDGGYSPAGINSTLRHLRIFFKWLISQNILKKPIEVRMLKVVKKESHITPQEIHLIQSSEMTDFFKSVLRFYELTGCRPKEAFMGEIRGNWYVVKGTLTKTGIDREFYIPNDDVRLMVEWIISERNRFIDSGSSFQYAVDRMYESTRQAFDRAKRSMKINPKDRKLTLYSYRHTYGITRALSTGDIYLVAEEMGHADISTTYKNYAKIKPSIIERDFPQYKHVCKLGRFAGLNPKITNTKKRVRSMGVVDVNLSVEPSPQDVKKLYAPNP